MSQGYSEEELVKNRSALLLSGGSEADRRAWAEEAASRLPADGPLVVVTAAEALPRALAAPRGVVFLPDAGALGFDAQAKVVHCILLQDERPKVIIGLGSNPGDAVSSGALRDDLAYRLRAQRVDLSTPGLKNAIKARREAQAKLATKKPVSPVSTTVFISRPPARRPSAPSASGGKKASAAAKPKSAKRR